MPDAAIPTANGAPAADAEFIRFVSNAVNMAKEVFFEFGDHSYGGDVLAMKVGEYILIRARHADDGLVRIPEGYDLCRLRTVPESGRPSSFVVKLIQKKIPHVMVSFPTALDTGHERKFHRHFMKQSTPVVLRRRENALMTADRSGLGTILNISEGGVMLQTSLPLEKGDRLNIFLDVGTADKKKVEMPCVVRRSEQDVKTYTCGLEFVNAPADSLRAIAQYVAGR